MKRLVLLGGGHAQIQAVKAFGSEPPAETSLVLINRSRFTPYSGMLPGLIAGHYSHAECHIDLAWLSAQSNVEFVEQEATRLDLAARRVHCADGSAQSYDVLSIDTGSTPPLGMAPGAAEHALPVKPIEAFLPRARALVAECGTPGEHSIALVGGGAAGFEVLLALAYRIERQCAGRVTPQFHWVTDTQEILPTFTRRVRSSALRIMARRCVTIHTGARVERVTHQGIEFAGGRRVDAGHVIWVTGAAPASMFAAAGLQTDARGFIAVDPALRSLSHPNVFACGDVASVLDYPRPKAGVFAVRQGPPLTRNLRLALANREPSPFAPQERFLVILSTGERYAIATKGGYAIEGAWVWAWKDWIDRRFTQRFQPTRREPVG
jgi:selenide,water dikinase